MPAARTRNVPARSLEVSTDAPLPPTVSIISPTPRAFTFPINDTRFPNSPSSSPFEPTLKSIPSTPPPFRPFSPTSSIGSDSSLSVPDSTFSSPTAPASSRASSRRRRRSTVSDVEERRPKKGEVGYIKRPENAWMLFRKQHVRDVAAAWEEAAAASDEAKKQRQADLSKSLSQQWKNLPPEEKQYWEELAKQKKEEHKIMYPNYQYRPQRKKNGKSKKGKGQKDADMDTDAESFTFQLPVSSSPARSLTRDYATSGHGHGHGRRAISAPTPPPAFQTIQLPTVWMPSCPTSPTLIPRISGRSPAPSVANIPPPTESAPLTTFDYAPNDQFFLSGFTVHSTYENGNAYDANGKPLLDSYQNMYQIPDNSTSGMGEAPTLHPLSIPREPTSCAPSSIMSPAESIAASLISSTDSYASSAISPSTSQSSVPFTPDDALRMMSLSMPKDVPENVDMDMEGDVASEMPYGFWPSTEALWANMETLMSDDDFNLGSIPPVELGLAQFDMMPMQGSTSSSSPSSSGTIRPDSDAERDDFMQHMSEEHDYHDVSATPGLDTFSGIFAHDNTNW
ncbi:hypothetical protein PYCCODRAFT_1362856 [Trametes coccinea BRFM310]|uniref:HMG box domain-containing protein n=1 Tax=Trametes coccinea (strain BRFM310) TaxID=1353009 RepID=A0A1Y2IWH8_TRAC3|nr:hypothetical protein PYCCODRAFT_1362856 [Trametes coccinea BRFM310]